jgi:hypothetical protein
MTITITGLITDNLFDQFIDLIELHGGEFFGEYDTRKVKGDLSIGNPKKGTLEGLMVFVEAFCRKRNLVIVKSDKL